MVGTNNHTGLPPPAGNPVALSDMRSDFRKRPINYICLQKHCIPIMKRQSVMNLRHYDYCFYIAVNRICVTISRVDGALKPWSAIHLVVGNSKQKPAYLDLPVPVM